MNYQLSHRNFRYNYLGAVVLLIILKRDKRPIRTFREVVKKKQIFHGHADRVTVRGGGNGGQPLGHDCKQI